METRYPPNSMVPGTIYRVVRELGAGGMGRVYEVEDTSLCKRYALKTVRSASASTQRGYERPQLEPRLLARVSHPNIVNVFTAGTTNDGLFYFVMELLNGDSLTHVLRKAGRRDPATAVTVGVDIAEALQEVHRHGIVHRNVKPGNIFIATQTDMSARAKLVDFGIAKVFDQLGVASEYIAATPSYSSPEQLQGASATPQMDIWSLGVVLFEAVAGRLPFTGSNIPESMQAVTGPTVAPALSEFVSEIPSSFVKLVAWMLEQDPERRVHTMSVVAHELRRIQVTTAAHQKPVTGAEVRTQVSLLGIVSKTLPLDPAFTPPGLRSALPGAMTSPLRTMTAPLMEASSPLGPSGTMTAPVMKVSSAADQSRDQPPLTNSEEQAGRVALRARTVLRQKHWLYWVVLSISAASLVAFLIAYAVRC